MYQYKTVIMPIKEKDCGVGDTRQIDNWKFVPTIAALWFTDRKLVFTHTAAFGLTFA